MKVFKIVIILLNLIIFNQVIYGSSVENMNINATLMPDGSMNVEQKIIYNITESINVTYIDYPYNSNATIFQQGYDSSYDATDISITSIEKVNEDGQTIQKFSKYKAGIDASTKFYTVDKRDGICRVKIYDKVNNDKVGYRIKYVAKNVSVKHKDVGEFFYNFIGDSWKEEIKELNIDVHILNNQKEILAWGHGPRSGNLKIVSNSHINLQIKNLLPGNLVAARIMFDRDVLKNSTKTSNLSYSDTIFEQEGSLFKNHDLIIYLRVIVIVFVVGIIIYWIYLLIKYEKDSEAYVVEMADEEIFNRYNPIIASCIESGRDVHSRDIIAIILNLIEKGNIKHEFKKKYDVKYDILHYEHILTPVKEKERTLDRIEKYVYDWFFEKSEKEKILYDRLQDIPKEEDASIRLNELNNIIKEELDYIGAQTKSVPLIVRIFNNMLVVIASIIAIADIFLQVALGTVKSVDTSYFQIFIDIFLKFGLVNLIMYLLTFIMKMLKKLKGKIKVLMKKISEHPVVITTVTIFVIFAIIATITSMISGNTYLILDELLICMAVIITITDNMMQKNSKAIAEDYTKLKFLKDKIKNGSMLDEKYVQHRVLWGKYLAYAISFGVGKHIIKQIKDISLDERIREIVENNYSDFYNDMYKIIKDNVNKQDIVKTKKTTFNKNSLNKEIGKKRGKGGSFSGGGFFSRRWRKKWRNWSFLIRPVTAKKVKIL